MTGEATDRGRLQAAEMLLRRITEELAGGALPAAPAATEELARWVWLLNAAARPSEFRKAVHNVAASTGELEAIAAYLFSHWCAGDDDRAKLEVVLYRLVRNQAGDGPLPAAMALATAIQQWLGLPAPRGMSRTAGELRRARTTLDQCRSLAEIRISGLLSTVSALKQQVGQEEPRADVLAELVLLYASLEAVLNRFHPGSDTTTLDFAVLLDRPETQAASADSREPGQAAATRPASGSSLRADPLLDENRLTATISSLVAALKAAAAPVTSIRLPNTELFLSELEVHCLQTEYSASEESFRAELNTLVRRAAGLRAYLQEELELYRTRRRTDHLWKKHLESAAYFAPAADRAILQVETFSGECTRRGLRKKAGDLTSVAAELRKVRSAIPAMQELAAEQPALTPA